MFAALVFVFQVDLLCDWIELPKEQKACGWAVPVLTALFSFVVMLVNAYLFMRS
jgi:hypothetical protein